MSEQPVSTPVTDGADTHSNGKSDGKNSQHSEDLITYATVHGEWENRQISIFGVVKRFITSLSYGQDLTKLSMPSEFLNPYSILEMGSGKYLHAFPLLFQANNEEDPIKRMAIVMRWFFASVRGGKLYKKPYNSVVDETFVCYIDDPEHGPTAYVSQQVSHHPPISAYYLWNEKEQITVMGTIRFDVKFYINSACLTTDGYLKITLGKFGEEYLINKGYPDLTLKNVVFGTRKMQWNCALDIYCAKTNCNADVSFSFSGNDDIVTGSVTQDDNECLTYSGCVDKEVTYQIAGEDKEQILLDHSHELHPTIRIPPPLESDAFPSLRVWRDVTKAIIANDMTAADEAKQLVEQEQRRRVKLEHADEQKDRTYFRYDEESEKWVYKEGSFQMSMILK